jgi:transcriptional regulator with XRE-family HTH domain
LIEHRSNRHSLPTLLHFLFSPSHIFYFSASPPLAHWQAPQAKACQRDKYSFAHKTGKKYSVSLTKMSKQIRQMGKETFGEYIRRLREEMNLPLRKVAAQLDVDTSTLSKVERGERPMSIDYLKPLSQILKTDYKELQIRFLADSINANYGKLEYLEDGLSEVINQLKKNKK